MGPDPIEVRWGASPTGTNAAAGACRSRRWGRSQACPMGTAMYMGTTPPVPMIIHFTTVLQASGSIMCIGSLLLFCSRSTITPGYHRRKEITAVLTSISALLAGSDHKRNRVKSFIQ